ncbi:hypothetical protein [Desulfitobacterium hafniense]|nr:hypothetical protein [Desulfitobacterium hafniense]
MVVFSGLMFIGISIGLIAVKYKEAYRGLIENGAHNLQTPSTLME